MSGSQANHGYAASPQRPWYPRQGLPDQVSLKDGSLNHDISLKTVVLRNSFLMTTIHLYGLDFTALAGPHSKSLPHHFTIAHVC